MRSRTKLPALLAAAAAGLALAGCQDTLARRDGISFGAGDAVAANRAVHAIDPWPREARNTTIPTSGRRIATAIEAYEARGTEAEKKGGQSPVLFAPVAAASPGGAAP